MCGKIVAVGDISLCFILSLYQCALVGIPGRLFYQYFILGLARECGGEGNGNPLQYSCLENPMDRGAWWAVVHRVPKGRTRLKWLSVHREFGMGMYQVLYLKWIINNGLLEITCNSAQCYVAAWMEGALGKNGYMYTYGWVPSLSTWNYCNIVC